MNIKKSKIALLLGASLFLTMPLSSTFADQNNHDIKVPPMGGVMQNIKSELRGYVKGVKSNDAQKMQQHLDALLKLSAMPAMDHSDMQMGHTEMTNEAMAAMDHSKMDHSDMPMDHTEMANEAMAAMDHSKMDHSEMKMEHGDMASQTMPAMDHSDMKMDHGDMKMDSTDHDMSTMPSMAGMSAEQHHQHMMYMQGITGLNDLFKQLGKTQDKAEIKLILGKIKEHIKKNQQLFS